MGTADRLPDDEPGKHAGSDSVGENASEGAPAERNPAGTGLTRRSAPAA
ncbi:hypothetical protein [Herbidospora cretacea]|nr:hypothetical protein [Herbidospora cretacea]